jgi:tetratricopeptide (TPR) repeat protein
MRGMLVAPLLVVLALLWSAPVVANPNPKAAAHYKQGKAFLDSGQYDKAIVEFEAAYALDKVASHLFNIARAYHLKNDLDKALEYYQKYLDAEPASPRAAEVRGLIAQATQTKKDNEDKAKAEADAKAKEAKRVAAAAHVKQAEAFVLAGAYVKAGDEHRAAFAIDDDPTHLLAAAEAYRKQDLYKARDAYTAYLEKVPMGELSDVVRGKVAATTREIDKLEDDARKAKVAEQLRLEKEKRDRELALANAGKKVELRRPSFKRGWIVVGGAMLLTGLVADLRAPNADNGKLDASDFAGPVLYGLGALAVLGGVF